MNIHRLWVMGFCLSVVLPLAAQHARFANRNLQRMAAAVQSRHGVDCTRAGTTRVGRNLLVVTEDTLGRIDHIGWKLFPEQMTRENPSPVYRFVERYLLELCLWTELPTPAQRLKEDKVYLRFFGHEEESVTENIARRLPRIDSLSSLMVLTDNSRYSVAVYRQGKPQFAMRFPIRYELLWGMNKKEAENAFYAGLLRYAAPRPEPLSNLPADEEERLVPVEGKDCLMLPGDSYLIDGMNSSAYYVPVPGGGHAPVRDMRYPGETACNLFLLPCGGEVTAVVTQRLYNRRKLSFETPLHKLLSFCRATGCRTYVGIETVTEDEVTGTAVLLNPSCGYFHQLYFKMPVETLPADGRLRIEVELYAYIPTHNIGRLIE